MVGEKIHHIVCAVTADRISKISNDRDLNSIINGPEIWGPKKMGTLFMRMISPEVGLLAGTLFMRMTTRARPCWQAPYQTRHVHEANDQSRSRFETHPTEHANMAEF